jgi:hypothetical protein
MRYVISAILLLSLCLSLIAACAQPKVNLPPTVPKPPVTKPSPTSDNQSTKQAETPNPEIAEESWFPVTTFSGQVDETTPSFHIYGTEWRLTWTIDTVSLEKAVFKLTIYPKDAPYAIWQTVSNAGKNTGTVNYFVSNVDKRDYFIRISSQYVQNWTIEIEDNGTAATSYPIEISSIHYRGTVFPPDPPNGFCYERVEPDEYVVIKNLSTCFQDLTGWQLKNISKPSPTFKFPPAYILPGGIIRIYTDEYHPEFGGLTFYYGFGDIWSNDHADIAVLYDALGNEVYRKSYRLPMKIGGGD